jgi:hypothetical protein
MEFKIKYLTSYASLLNQYFLNLNFREVVSDVVSTGDTRGLMILLITCMVIKPQEFIPANIESISGDLFERAVEYMQSDEFEDIYKRISQIDTIPKLSFQQMRQIKTEYMDVFCRPEILSQLTNSARIMASWLDAILEFTVLKHEALILTVKKQNILQKIKNISIEWPRKKQFIERAYKILLFTKRVKLEINITMFYLKKNNLYDFMDKSKMEHNKVYLKIKEIENRENMIAQKKKEIEQINQNDQAFGSPDPGRIEGLINEINNEARHTAESQQQTEINEELPSAGTQTEVHQPQWQEHQQEEQEEQEHV